MRFSHLLTFVFMTLLMAAVVRAQVAVIPRLRIGIVTDVTVGVRPASIAALTTALRALDVDVIELTVRQLPEAIDARRGIDGLLLPDATHASIDAIDSFRAFAATGRHLILLGPKPFSAIAEKGVKKTVANIGEFGELSCAVRMYEPRSVQRIASVASSSVLGLPQVSVTGDLSVSPVFTLPRDGQSSVIPLLHDQSGPPVSPLVAAAVLNHYGGAKAGSRWLLCGIGLDAMAAQPDLLRWLALTARATLNAELRLPESIARTDLPNALGVTVARAGYSFTQDEEIAEGSARIRELGTTSIKLWFTQLEKTYPRTKWPDATSLKEIAQSAPFDKVFRQPFTTYFLEAFSVGQPHPYWRTDPTPDRLREDERQFYELSLYLLKTFAGSGKTFVLQNWEGDWAVRPTEDAKIEVPDADFERMVDWLNARQRGVDRARAEVGEQGVRVLCAAEVNQVRSSIADGRRNVIDAVIPKTNVDLVSYSCYDAQGDPRVLRASLEHIASQLKPKAGIDGCRVYVGEYGMPETAAGLDKVRQTIPDVVDVSLAFGCPYVLYWQLYCNEALRKPVVHNDDTRGLWLIKPDGTKAWAWDYLQARIAGREVPK